MPELVADDRAKDAADHRAGAGSLGSLLDRFDAGDRPDLHARRRSHRRSDGRGAGVGLDPRRIGGVGRARREHRLRCRGIGARGRCRRRHGSGRRGNVSRRRCGGCQLGLRRRHRLRHRHRLTVRGWRRNPGGTAASKRRLIARTAGGQGGRSDGGDQRGGREQGSMRALQGASAGQCLAHDGSFAGHESRCRSVAEAASAVCRSRSRARVGRR